MLTILNKANFDIEDFDDEIVLVNFQTGVYYTVKGSGPLLLRAFESGISVDVLTKFVLDRFGSERLNEVKSFTAQLLQEEIIITMDNTTGAEADLTDLALLDAPILEKFDDVSDLIKLDPIHDVSDLGWPHKK